MDELPAHAKAVLRRAREHDQCRDDDARRRVRQGVARAVGVSAGCERVFDLSRVAAQPAAPAAKGAPLLGLLGKLTVAAAVVALAGSGVALRRRAAEPPEPDHARASAVVSVPLVSPASPSSPARGVREATPVQPLVQDERPSGTELSSRPQAGRRARAHGARTSTPETLDAEVLLLRRLDKAVARRDLHEADRLLATHRARFPQPALLEERQGFVALVACMKHGPDRAASARTFVARYPNSVLTARVQHECEAAGP